jgi:spermidine/putrescine transport system permease protein
MSASAITHANSTISRCVKKSAVVLGMVYVMIPFMFLPLFALVDTLDRAQVEASLDLGANRVQTFVKVILPQTLPGIMGGAVIVFIPSVGNFIVPDVLGGALLAFVISMDDLVITYFISGVGDTTLPVFIFGMIRRGVKPEINAIATLIILASVVIAALGLWLRSRKTD